MHGGFLCLQMLAKEVLLFIWHQDDTISEQLLDSAQAVNGPLILVLLLVEKRLFVLYSLMFLLI